MEIKERIKILKRIISGYILILFILLNLFCLTGAIFPVIGQPHFKEKIMMRTAVALNEVYIFPLSKIFGNHNILTAPFYSVRNKLYNTAYNMYPKTEAEKDMFWYVIKFPEYEKLYSPMYMKYFNNDSQKLVKDNTLFDWTDELYQHAISLSNSTISDSDYNKAIFKAFNDVTFFYISDRPLLYRAKYNYNYINLINNNNEIYRFNNLLFAHEKLKKYCQKYNQKSLDKFYEDFQIYHHEALNTQNSLVYILSNKFITHTLECNDPMINQYIDSEKVLMKYLNYPKINKDNKDAIWGNLYKWQLNKELQHVIIGQCRK